MLEPRNRRPAIPGQILYEHFLKERQISITAFAEAVGRTRKHISNVIHGHSRIEAELAARMAAVLDTTPQFWLNLQNAVDLWEAKEKIKSWHPVHTFPAPTHAGL